jgi:hypothetical protein
MKMELSEMERGAGGQKNPSTLKFGGKIGLFNYINIQNVKVESDMLLFNQSIKWTKSPFNTDQCIS